MISAKLTKHYQTFPVQFELELTKL